MTAAVPPTARPALAANLWHRLKHGRTAPILTVLICLIIVWYAGAVALNRHRVDLQLSRGGAEAAQIQGGVNTRHRGDPAADTADIDDRTAGNLRLDYVLPSSDLTVRACGVFWPGGGEDGQALAEVSDHHLVWLDITPS